MMIGKEEQKKYVLRKTKDDPEEFARLRLGARVLIRILERFPRFQEWLVRRASQWAEWRDRKSDTELKFKREREQFWREWKREYPRYDDVE